MSRHQKSRRRSYGRRQHELKERPQVDGWPFDAGGDAEPQGSGFEALDALGEIDEGVGLQFGHLFARQGWRWAQGRG